MQQVFLKENLHESLEEARMAKFNRMAIIIQARVSLKIVYYYTMVHKCLSITSCPVFFIFIFVSSCSFSDDMSCI